MSTVRQPSIVCSSSEVRALLDGRVSLLVRPMHPQPAEYVVGHYNDIRVLWPGKHPPATQTSDRLEWAAGCSFGQPGEVRWVRETWAIKVPFLSDTTLIAYRADGDRPTWKKVRRPANSPIIAGEALVERWRGVRRMPAWASRLSVEMGAVRIARLQDLTEEDAMAAGIVSVPFRPDDGFPICDGYMVGPDDGKSTLTSRAVDAFAAHWDFQYGKRSPWASNPWVWLIGVKPAEVRA